MPVNPVGYAPIRYALAALFVVGAVSPSWAASTIESALVMNVRQLTFEGKRAGEGYFSADGTKMIFQSERDGANPYYQIYLMDFRTGDVEHVSNGVGKTTCAWIHPSGERVLYASTHDDPNAHEKMRAELAFRASGKTKRYSWDYDEQYEIYGQDLQSGQKTNLTNARGYDAEGSYSPNGEKIAFASNRRAYQGGLNKKEQKLFDHSASSLMDIYLMNADGTNVERLTDTLGYDGGPFFSADGRKITWRRFSEDGHQAEIFTMDLATRQEKQLTRTGVMSWAPFFHPSGDYLIFTSNREGYANFELFLVDAEGRREPVRVTYTDGFDGLPVFSPDGKKLSWTSKRTSQKSQIYMADWNDDEARRLLSMAPEISPEAAQETSPSNTSSVAATTDEISATDARLHVEALTDKAMEGRLTGTAGARRASRYVASVFEGLGLVPAGDKGTWFQAFDFAAGVSLGDKNQLHIDGYAPEKGFTLNQDWRPLAVSKSGAIATGEIVFAGYGIVAPETDEVPDYDAYGDLDVNGKWVMVLHHQPDDITAQWRRHLLHYSDLAFKVSVAKQRGAKGLIVVVGPRSKSKDRLVALKMDVASAGSSLGVISLHQDVAARMLAQNGVDLAQLQKRLDDAKMTKSFILKDIKVSAHIDITHQIRQGRNVVARLFAAQGSSTKPAVVIGAHLDHLGYGEISGSLARADEQGAVHSGADDNASGVAALIEVAQYLSAQKQNGTLKAERDMLFIAWSGEELGTLGSLHYTEKLAANGTLRDHVSAYLNMDMVGRLKDKLYLQGTGSSPVWAREIERRNIPVGLSIATKSDPYLPTDSTPFYMQGVPVLNAFTGAHEDYSSPRDTAKKLNYTGIRDVARLMAGIGRSLAKSKKEPAYIQVTRRKSDISRKHIRAYLGTIPSYGQDNAIKGVKLQGAIKGAPAQAAGIKNGDVLVGLAGVEIGTIHDFMNALAGLKVDEKTDMTIIREGKKLILTVVPAAKD